MVLAGDATCVPARRDCSETADQLDLAGDRSRRFVDHRPQCLAGYGAERRASRCGRAIWRWRVADVPCRAPLARILQPQRDVGGVVHRPMRVMRRQTGRERECRAMTGPPNVLLILTDQQQHPPPYESEELAAFRREHLAGVERLRQNGVSFRHHYPMAAACAPSRASLLTGQYPSLHGVTQTDGVGKAADGNDVFWLAPDTVPTLGDWFRAGGYRTYFKGKWHAAHAHLDADDGDGLLQSIDDDGTPIEVNIEKYLEADL